jgi:hypothetical protein
VSCLITHNSWTSKKERNSYDNSHKYLLCRTTDIWSSTYMSQKSLNSLWFQHNITQADKQKTHPLYMNWLSVVLFAPRYWLLNSWPELWGTCDLEPRLSWDCIGGAWKMEKQHVSKTRFQSFITLKQNCEVGEKP